MARTVRAIASGIYFGEAPRWREGRLWFSDFYAHAVMSVSLSGDLRTEFTIDDQPSGLGWLPDGSMLIVGMTKREVLRRSVNGDISVHARLGDIATFHCNDMVVDQNGRAYVGNFGLNLDEEAASRPIEEVIADHVTAKLACIFPGGEVRVAADEMHFPNGSVITQDGKMLIVAETLGVCLTAVDIADDGSLSNRRVWAPTGMRIPDGICLYASGAVWFANPMANECVRIAEGGEILEVIDTGQLCFACMLGGDDGKSLFMLTADSADARTAAAAPAGQVLVAEVDSPRAGLP